MKHSHTSNAVLTISACSFGLCLFIAGCGGGPEEPAATPPPVTKPAKPATPDLPTPPSIALQQGKETFELACITCHTKGRDEAPIVFDATAWSPRITQGTDTLYDHAINGGFFTSEHSEFGMPARGGKKNLTDDQVKSAVDYILYVVKQSS